MIETEFKALMFLDQYVDANLLEKGIYTCSRPFLYSKEETIEDLISRGKRMKDMGGNCFISDKYFEYLKVCELVSIRIEIKPTEQ